MITPTRLHDLPAYHKISMCTCQLPDWRFIKVEIKILKLLITS